MPKFGEGSDALPPLRQPFGLPPPLEGEDLRIAWRRLGNGMTR